MSTKYDQVTANDILISNKGTVTQTTSITTGVTLNASAGVITTVAASLGGGTGAAFNLSNTYITPTSVVIPSIAKYNGTWGTNGIPVVAVQGQSNSVATIELINVGANALAGTVEIAYVVI